MRRLQLALAVSLAATAALPAAVGSATTSPPPGSGFRDVSVSPRHAYFAGKPIRIAFRAPAPAPIAMRVDVVREATHTPVWHLTLTGVQAAAMQHVTWDGVTSGGDVAPNGTYHLRLTAPGAMVRNGATFTLHGHIYPIRGRHRDRGADGAFGVPRSGGRTHEGFDVYAACGTKLVAARGGTVVRSIYDPVLYGNLLIVHGERTERDYWYAHMQHASPLHAGDRARTGQAIGRVGKTGNARTIGCQLHLEIRRRGVPFDPAPELHAWDAWS
jgi:murein DD-endopeptidase MepM/ murein hydrolase activator NlpD